MKPDDARILLIDNYDSFTYNLVQAFAAQGAQVLVYRNDAIDENEALSLEATHLVISPGPGRPEDAGVSLRMIDAFAEKLPMLGVCLGHQCLVSHFGGDIVRAERLMHGKTSMVKHDDRTVFRGLSQPFEAGRYHSLCADHNSMPDVLELTWRRSFNKRAVRSVPKPSTTCFWMPSHNGMACSKILFPAGFNMTSRCRRSCPG